MNMHERPPERKITAPPPPPASPSPARGGRSCGEPWGRSGVVPAAPPKGSHTRGVGERTPLPSGPPRGSGGQRGYGASLDGWRGWGICPPQPGLSWGPQTSGHGWSLPMAGHVLPVGMCSLSLLSAGARTSGGLRRCLLSQNDPQSVGKVTDKTKSGTVFS